MFLHFFFPGEIDVPDSRILPLVEKTMDRENPRDWYYALMDYGTRLSAEGMVNPNRRSRGYKIQARFEGSLRQLRGRVLDVILETRGATLSELRRALDADPRLQEALRQLVEEGFLARAGGRYSFR